MKVLEGFFVPVFMSLTLLLGAFFGFMLPVVLIIALPVLLGPIVVMSGILYVLRLNARSESESEPRPEFLPEIANLISVNFKKDLSIPFEKEIASIQSVEVPILVSMLPADGVLAQNFFQPNSKLWAYEFFMKSKDREFKALGLGADPMKAFARAKAKLLSQIHGWHLTQSPELHEAKAVGRSAPSVLIVEDDPDVMAMTASIFKKLGCKILTSQGLDEARAKMNSEPIDILVLDWWLGRDCFADQLIGESNFSSSRHTQVITHSASDRSKIHLPENFQFEHLDHWQKPASYEDLTARASELLHASGW